MNITQATWFIISNENMRSKQDLDIWCGDMGRQKLYLYVKNLAPDHWNRIATPENSVRRCYQEMLEGYKIYK